MLLSMTRNVPELFYKPIYKLYTFAINDFIQDQMPTLILEIKLEMIKCLCVSASLRGELLVICSVTVVQLTACAITSVNIRLFK